MSWINVYMFSQAILAGVLITTLLDARRRIKTQAARAVSYEQKTERWQKRCEFLARELRAAKARNR